MNKAEILLGEAMAYVVEKQKASASYLQRKLRIGYSDACYLLERLEELGVIGKGIGAVPRKIFWQKADILNN